MSHLYLLSPSSAVLDRASLRRGIKQLEAVGHTVEVDPCALDRDTRFAGADADRLAAIKRAANSGADAVMTTRGGYGLSRLLHVLPYKAIEKSIDNPRSHPTVWRQCQKLGLRHKMKQKTHC